LRGVGAPCARANAVPWKWPGDYLVSRAFVGARKSVLVGDQHRADPEDRILELGGGELAALVARGAGDRAETRRRALRLEDQRAAQDARHHHRASGDDASALAREAPLNLADEAPLGDRIELLQAQAHVAVDLRL